MWPDSRLANQLPSLKLPNPLKFTPDAESWVCELSLLLVDLTVKLFVFWESWCHSTGFCARRAVSLCSVTSLGGACHTLSPLKILRLGQCAPTSPTGRKRGLRRVSRRDEKPLAPCFLVLLGRILCREWAAEVYPPPHIRVFLLPWLRLPFPRLLFLCYMGGNIEVWISCPPFPFRSQLVLPRPFPPSLPCGVRLAVLQALPGVWSCVMAAPGKLIQVCALRWFTKLHGLAASVFRAVMLNERHPVSGRRFSVFSGGIHCIALPGTPCMMCDVGYLDSLVRNAYPPSSSDDLPPTEQAVVC
ncbi:uncharacterized protein AAG666_007013 isoform 2-T6 [Megaptera novaeangliae]